MTPRPRLWHAYDLRQAFLLGMLLPLAGVSATVVLGLVNWAEQSLESRLQGEIELISRAVAPDIGRNLDRGRDGEIRRSLETLFSIRRVYGAAVYDEHGDLVVAAGTIDRDLRSSRAASRVVRTGEDDGQYRRIDGQNVYGYFTPLLDQGGRIHGLLQLTRDRGEIDASVQSLRTMAWGAWLFGVVSSVLVMLALYRRLVGQRVRALLGRMSELAGGDRRVRLEVRAPSEFVQVAAGFNAMVDAIRDAEVELRQRQSRERELERKLQESEKIAAVGRVAQGLAHELGSPLSVVDGRVRRMQQADRDGRLAPSLDDVRRQIARMGDIVRQLLHYGRAGSGTQSLLPLRALLERILADAQRDGIATTLDPDSVPDRVPGNPVRVELALSNLVRNAVRHARTRVHARVVRAHEYVCVYVSDDGPGVAPEDRARVFEPFFTRQPPGEGTGLGLAIAASVMLEQGGEVRCEDAPGGGACFVLLFARAHDDGDRT
jgi:signal transduction histidine kinase